MKIIFISLLGFILIGCNSAPKVLTDAEKQHYLTLGDSLSSLTQQILLKNVSQQIAQGGTLQAVDFCNENAVKLTQSLEDNLFKISRLSNKNRNPKNGLTTEIDQKAWNEIAHLPKEISKKEILLQEENKVVYYKAIPLGMPTCLLCHGTKNTEITPETWQIISQKYPDDKATDYKMGELRGLWKISFEK